MFKMSVLGTYTFRSLKNIIIKEFKITCFIEIFKYNFVF